MTSTKVNPPHKTPCAWMPSVLELKPSQLISHMHYSCCPNPIDLLLSSNLISNPILFVMQCPSPQHNASFTCPAWVISAIGTLLITSPLWLSREHLSALQRCSFDTAPVILMADPASCAAPLLQTATKDDYLGNILLIVHLGRLLIKT